MDGRSGLLPFPRPTDSQSSLGRCVQPISLSAHPAPQETATASPAWASTTPVSAPLRLCGRFVRAAAESYSLQLPGLSSCLRPGSGCHYLVFLTEKEPGFFPAEALRRRGDQVRGHLGQLCVSGISSEVWQVFGQP